MGCAALAAAAVALPVGIFIGKHGAERPITEAGGTRGTPVIGAAPSRNSYSPDFLSDPYVIDQQRRVAETLTTSCRQANMHCEEAAQAWQRIREAEAGE